MHIAIPFLLLSVGCKDPLVVKEYVALVSVSPGQGAAQVAVNTDIIAGFSEALIPSTVDAQSAYLEDDGGLPVVADVEYNKTSHWIVINPESDLTPSTTYTVTFTSAIRGKHSGNLLAPLQSTFTTAGENPSNDLPIADAGPDQSVAVGEIVQLSGSNSADPEGAALSYAWRLVSAPNASESSFADATVAQPRFTPDLQGEYIVGLTVNDGMQNSSEDFVIIAALGTSEAPVDTGSAPLEGNAEPDTGVEATDSGASSIDTGPSEPSTLDSGSSSDGA